MLILLIIVLAVSASLVLYFLFLLDSAEKKASNLNAELSILKEKYDQDIQKYGKYVAALKANLQRLAKWSVVADAEIKSEQMIRAAKKLLENATINSEKLKTETQQYADKLILNSNERAKQIIDEAAAKAKAAEVEAQQKLKLANTEVQSILNSAASRAKEAIDSANAKAKEIAGGAYEILRNANLYENAAKAMKNIIHGYGDQYLVPTRNFLDDLAEDYDHTQSGKELKMARDYTKAMIRNNIAATCDYVEANRRETAINFVVDAFNGKVDSILSRVKENNAGTLEQEIRDAFAVVNYNGAAFRHARITEEYLNARLRELKWAVITQELKLREKEEQRRIKEQMREEEKARKEYERAMRDAAKEEDLLRRAMEKAQAQIQQATAEQKAQYEQQLRALSEKLKEAEERNQRAISMAQQTRRGHVYIISNIGSFGENVFKIGLTRRLEPLDRVRELGDSSVPFEFDVHALIFSEDAPSLENQLHRHFVMKQINKVNHRKEFFKISLSDIRAEVEKLGLAVKWTMLAEAREYRESLSIEKAIENNPQMREAWLNRQLELEPVGVDNEQIIETNSDEDVPIASNITEETTG